MKILFLTPWYPESLNPHYGVFIRDQAETLAALHPVTLIAARIDYQSFGFLSYRTELSVYHDIEEHRIIIKRSFPLYNQLNYLAIIVWYSWKVARKFRPDIVHGNIGYPGAFWSWAVSKLIKVPYVVTEHSTYFSGNLRTFFHRILTIPFMRRSLAIIAVSTRSAADISSFVGKKPVVVPNIIKVDSFRMVNPALAGPVCHFGFLGGLDGSRKGLDILLKAAKSVKQEFVLHIGGQGKRFGYYKEIAKALGMESQCIFYGLIPEHHVPDFMSKLHFFVSSSRAEGFGMVIAEAMACGLPVVVTRSGGPEDFVTPENGLLIKADDVEEMTTALEKMIREYPTYSREAIRNFVVSNYAPEVIRKKILDVYSLR